MNSPHPTQEDGMMCLTGLLLLAFRQEAGVFSYMHACVVFPKAYDHVQLHNELKLCLTGKNVAC